MGCTQSNTVQHDINLILKLCSQIPLGYYLTRSDITAMCQGCRVINVSPGDIIFNTETAYVVRDTSLVEAMNFFGIILKGEVDMISTASSTQTISKGPGDLILDEYMFDSRHYERRHTETRQYNLHAKTEGVILAISTKTFRSLFKSGRIANIQSMHLNQPPISLLSTIFPNLETQQLHLLSRSVKYHVLESGETLYNTSEPPPASMFAVLTGRVRLLPSRLPSDQQAHVTVDQASLCPSVAELPDTSYEQVIPLPGEDCSTLFRRLRPRVQAYLRTHALSSYTVNIITAGGTFHEFALLPGHAIPSIFCIAMDKSLIMEFPRSLYDAYLSQINTIQTPQTPQTPQQIYAYDITRAIKTCINSAAIALMRSARIEFMENTGQTALSFLENIVPLSRIYTYEGGKVIQSESVTIDYLRVVLYGDVSLSINQGNNTTNTCYLHAGDYIDEIALVVDTTRQYILTALTHTVIIEIPRSVYESLVTPQMYATFVMRTSRDNSPIEVILHNDVTRDAFHQYTIRECSVENLLFYNTVIEFRSKMDGVTRAEAKVIKDSSGRGVAVYSYADLYTELLAIFNNYIRSGHAATEVNLRSDVVDRVRAALFDEPQGVGPDGLPEGLDSHLLDEPLNETMLLMKDTLQRFRKDPLFTNILNTMTPYRPGLMTDAASSQWATFGIGIGNRGYLLQSHPETID